MHIIYFNIHKINIRWIIIEKITRKTKKKKTNESIHCCGGVNPIFGEDAAAIPTETNT